MDIYVGNLSFDMSDADLRQIFEQFGEVGRANIVTDKFTGKSRGFGFIAMTSNDDAQKAIAELNGKEFDGRAIVVNEAKPREPRTGGGGGGGRSGGGGGFNRGGGGGRGGSGGGGGRRGGW